MIDRFRVQASGLSFHRLLSHGASIAGTEIGLRRRARVYSCRTVSQERRSLAAAGRSAARTERQKRHTILLALIFSVLLFTLNAFAAERVQCKSMKSRYVPGPVGYCVLFPPGYDSHPAKKFPVLYFLHGLGGDQTFLVTSGGWQIIEDLWEQKKIGEFVIITPQADNSFYINSRDGRVKYEDFFVREFMPQMEKEYRLLGTRKGRAISGVSMGGYGSLRLAFKYPRLFVSVAAHMPALLQQLPHGSRNAGFARFFGDAFGSPVDEAFWKTNTPFVYARKADLRGMKIYADCGNRDNYGFDAGLRQLDRLLNRRRVLHSFHIYPGQHDWEFVARHLRESLEFQSKAFGLK